MGYAVLHIQKGKGMDTGTASHIERTVMPVNADPTRTYLNRELAEYPENVHNRTEAVQHRLDTAGLKRKIGTNQVRLLRVMLSGSHDDMINIEDEGKLGKWCDDNMAWLRETFGKENVVSAVLHLDEKTPHIHATVVPIVSGERRKKKSNKKEDPAKKKYRKKSADAPRLCADDVTSREKLKAYQDSYGKKMSTYGLQRGIRGSDARHISNQQYFRNLMADKEHIQEDIECLLQMQEEKRQAVGELGRLEKEKRERYVEISTKTENKETELNEKQKELRKVKGQVQTEKLKGSLANTAINISDTVGSLLGKSRIRTLETDKSELEDQIESLKILLEETKTDYEKRIGSLNNEVRRLYNLVPNLSEMERIEKSCREMGFNTKMTSQLLDGKVFCLSGDLYSEKYNRKFRMENTEVRIVKDADSPELFRLQIDKTDVSQWFYRKYNEEREALKRSNTRVTRPIQNKKQGIRM